MDGDAGRGGLDDASSAAGAPLPSWKELEAKASELGGRVRELKRSGGDKGALTAALSELLDTKERLREAFEAAIAAEPDGTKRDEMRKRLPPLPKKVYKWKEGDATAAATVHVSAPRRALLARGASIWVQIAD